MPIDFDKIKNSIQDGAEAIVNKSKDLAEISKLNVKIISFENKIKELYKEIGEEFYSQYKEDKRENNKILKLCKEIEEIEKDIKHMKKKIENIKEK